MSLADTAYTTNILLYHALKAAENCSDIMLHYYHEDYAAQIDEAAYDAASGLSIEDSPELLKLLPDRLCDGIAREYLKALYPGYGYVGEESFDADEMSRDLFWCVDPICGSMGYKKKTGYFGTSVALIRRSSGPFIGVLNCPGLQIAGIASLPENAAYYAGNFKKYDTGGLRVVISSNRKNSEPFKEMISVLNPAVVDYQESVPTKSLGVLAGTYDLHFNLPADYQGGSPKIWDLAASQVFYSVEQKEFTDFDGNPFDLTGAGSHRYSNGYVMAKDRETRERCLDAFEKIK